ncbi:hypothetical protein HID58_053500, partial [Brassica napus]
MTSLQPTPAAAVDMLPPVAYSDNPSTSFAAKFVHSDQYCEYEVVDDDDEYDDNTPDYSANVTISNYFKDNDRILSPWRFAWLWTRQETLVSTLGANAKETQQGAFISLTSDTYCFLKDVTLVDLPSQTNDNCKGGVVVPGFRNAVMTENSTSFHITVSHYNRGYHTLPDVRLEYESECDALKRVTGTPDYL